MLAFFKKYISKKIFNILNTENEGLRLQFLERINKEQKEQRTNYMRQKYQIASNFRFNGEMILFYGEGEIICKEDSYVSDYSMLQSYTGCKILIGKGCSISSNVRIFTQTDVADQDFSSSKKEIKTGDVIIGDYVWIGANVVVNPGLKIGNNSIVGANSVVTKDIPENSIYGGVPAKLIRMKTLKEN